MSAMRMADIHVPESFRDGRQSSPQFDLDDSVSGETPAHLHRTSQSADVLRVCDRPERTQPGGGDEGRCTRDANPEGSMRVCWPRARASAPPRCAALD
ncbi:hypothetical protein EYF80_052625 [Liparis tanakae]|uniref:Uncharacterized protein n=1 Tax=Liparis tanakae TaxID=230148 RepID=A0A4Z2F7J8_9TELE|nr:hypothetical protein EYF80_052625 [Liparis tanakae]